MDRANTTTPPRNIPTWNREGYKGGRLEPLLYLVTRHQSIFKHGGPKIVSG